ncbi:hypothetical protein NDU88_005037 [Pleurodeles waltl]|uniref:Uncharacterized protein n=1 Tax=Pleurodeles waltl TaxID=8319 RepID=A0AAV7T9B5_PLEWA|nr:hypothetical protein NDU88_005037 [Pleurodeles waltl]
MPEDLQSVKKYLSADLKEVHKDLDEAVQECKDDERIDEIEWMQQEIIYLQVQPIELQNQAEDLENRSRRKNIHVGSPHIRGGNESYVKALFSFILGETAPPTVKHDRLHSVDLPHQPPSHLQIS